MPEWFENAYVYDVGVAQFVKFVRPLYPPDHPEGPVPDGPDVEAIKRAVSRLGRWPWNDGKYDRSFSNAFAHGKSGNVSESGLEGVQRQADVAGANGAFGERSHDILLYARIPAGIPHAGEFAYDAYALELLQQAGKMFDEPNPKPPTPSGTPRQQALNHMEKRVGYTENPYGSNFDSRTDGIKTAQRHTAQGGTWLDRTPWCGSWCYYALESAGVKPMGSFMASVAWIESYAKTREYCFSGWTRTRVGVHPGDLVVIGGYGVHVEMVRGFDGACTLTYGGNTSAGASGSQSNGGGAFKRVRYPIEVRGYAKVRYPGE